MTGSGKERVLLEWRGGDNAYVRLFRCSHVLLQNRGLLRPVSGAGLAAVGVEEGGRWRVFLERGDKCSVINTSSGIQARMPPL